MKTVRFDLRDCDGEQHTYEVELFSVDENARLQLLVAQPLIEAVGRAAKVLLPVLGEGGELDASVLDTEGIASALLPIPAMIEERGGPELIERIFARTARLVEIPELQSAATASGNDAPQTAVRQELKLASARDDAFGDGNMLEYWQAAAMVLIVNFTRLGRNGSPDWRQLVSRLTGGLLQPVSTATNEPSAGGRSGKK